MTTPELLLAAEKCNAGRCEDAISLFEAATQEQPSDPELHHQLGVCYSGACRSHSQVSLPLAIAYLEHAVNLTRTADKAELKAKYLDSLGNIRLRDHQPDRARDGLEQASRLYSDLHRMDEWAREEYNLGNACCDLAETGLSENWQEAVHHYENALQARTVEHDPLHFAATAQNLGTALRELPHGDRAANLRSAIRYYHAALHVYLRAHLSGKCADVHNNLGNAYLCLSETVCARPKNLIRGLRHLELALCGRTRASRPCDYAVTQFNRVQAYIALCNGEANAEFERALDCCREAAEGFRLCGDARREEVMCDLLRDLKTAADQAPT